MRQKIRGTGAPDDDSDDDDDDDGEGDDSWGKKKTYYTGDTADLEIGQEFQDAEDEEEAAKDLMKKKVARMKASDYLDDIGDDGSGAADDDDDESMDIQEVVQKKSSAKARKHDKVMGNLELIALSSGTDQVNILTLTNALCVLFDKLYILLSDLSFRPSSQMQSMSAGHGIFLA
jgi:hypothetical protein